MSATTNDKDTQDQAAEYFRLTLAQLSQNNLPVSPINYALMYFHVAGKDVDLSEKIIQLLETPEQWNDEEARALFTQFICQCPDNDYRELRGELLMTVAQIIGSVVDLAGQAALSNTALEKHMQHLAESSEPSEILNIAANIIADTRDFVEQSRNFENNLMDSTQEISLLKVELDHARRLATTDSLTGLHNRRGFDEALAKTIDYINLNKRSNHTGFCLLIIDIDHFKKVNDQHGHLVGDKVLVGISNVLQKQMRGKDHLSRFGGEEFAAILKDTPVTGAFTVAENLRKKTQKIHIKHIKTGLQIDQITISIGVACYRKGESIKDFLQRCDNALYRAKTIGRNRTVIAD